MQEDTIPTPFDDFLDRLARNEVVDPETFLKEHPDLSAEERALLNRLCRRRAIEATASTSTSPSPRPLTSSKTAPVERIGSYRLGELIGAGAMGAVFRAWDETLGREVAVKILGPDLVGGGERAERFLREVRAVARLRHPNIVGVYSAGEQDGLRYMAMELVPGSSLQEVTAAAAARGTRIPVRDVLRIGSEIARALHAAHDSGIVHRDVKPSNIRIATDGRAVLLDFGLAREEGALSLTESGAFRGSPQYASPEQVGLKGAPIDHRTDVFSLGATLYEAMTGVAPFRGETREQLFHAILLRDPVAPRKLVPGLQRDLETVVLAALEKDPGRRYATAAAFAEDLERARDGRAISARPPSPLGRLARWAKRQPAKAALTAALLLAIPVVVALGAFIAKNLPKIDQATEAARGRELARIVENAFFELGEGDPRLALPLFEEALRLDPDAPLARAGFAMALIEGKRAPEARAFLEGPAAGSRRTFWHEYLRRYAIRITAPDETTSSPPADRAAPSDSVDHFVIGMYDLKRHHIHEDAESAAEALARFQKAVMLAPVASPLYHYELGHAAWHLKANKEALDAAAAIESLWPESPERNFAVGRMLLHADTPRAVERLERAAWNPPRACSARQVIISWLSQNTRREDVLARLAVLGEETVEDNPSSTSCMLSLGTSYLALRRHEDAIRMFREIIRRDPTYADAHRLLSHALVQTRDHEGALLAAREGVRVAPDDPKCWNMVGASLTNLGRPEEAVQPFEEALRIDPDDASALCNLGKTLVLIGDFDRGVALLQKGHAIGSKLPGWSLPSQEWLTWARRVTALDKRRREALAGIGDPLGPDERASIAREVLRRKKLFAEAAAFYAAAFDEESSLLSQPNPDHVLGAASCALAAGLGQGADAPPDPRARAALRARARGWLAAEIESAAEALRSGRPDAAGVRVRLKAWSRDRVLESARAGEALQGGSPEEVEAWLSLWRSYDAVVSKP
jgi:tetratricopeptide (TPR) repeat protein